MTSKSLVCTKVLNQGLSWTAHFECVSVVLLRFPLKRGSLTGGWAYDRSGNQDKNPSLFNHLSATGVSVVLNDTKYPACDVIADFKKHTFRVLQNVYRVCSRLLRVGPTDCQQLC